MSTSVFPLSGTELPVGAGYKCYGCGHTHNDVMLDTSYGIPCSVCEGNDLLRINYGMSQDILFAFKFGTRMVTFMMDGKPRTQREGVW